jgi:PleD family two-component response regulator
VDTASADSAPHSRLLIVDDDPQSLRLLNAILERVAKIFFATSGDEALRQIGKHAPIWFCSTSTCLSAAMPLTVAKNLPSSYRTPDLRMLAQQLKDCVPHRAGYRAWRFAGGACHR